MENFHRFGGSQDILNVKCLLYIQNVLRFPDSNKGYVFRGLINPKIYTNICPLGI
jgi:hypothetical protein